MGNSQIKTGQTFSLSASRITGVGKNISAMWSSIDL
jgi:hypothetical protein